MLIEKRYDLLLDILKERYGATMVIEILQEVNNTNVDKGEENDWMGK